MNKTLCQQKTNKLNFCLHVHGLSNFANNDVLMVIILIIISVQLILISFSLLVNDNFAPLKFKLLLEHLCTCYKSFLAVRFSFLYFREMC